MTVRVCVFLGPSLPVAEAREVLPDAIYLPPAQMGDVHAALAEQPGIVCLIDGVFERVPAVWHKEILFALSRGVRVIGASSMGALRAAELHSFGMEGVGEVFEAFRDGSLTADDEVAVIHGAGGDGCRPLSEPLVNLRDGLRLAAARGLLTAAEHDTLIAGARQTFYPERSWPRLLDDARSLGMAPARVAAMQAFVERERPNVKRRDALGALRHIAATRAVHAAPPRFELETTEFWHQLVATTAQRARGSLPAAAASPRASAFDPAGSPRAAVVLEHARVALDEMRELRHRALLSQLVAAEADRAGVTIGRDGAATASQRLRLRHGLASADRTRAFLAANGLSDDDFAEACRLEALCDALIARAGRTLDAATLDELRRSGRYSALADAAAAAQRTLEARGLSRAALADVGLDERGLLAWYQAHRRPIVGSLEGHAHERGFRDVAAFLREVLRQYCASS